VSYCRWSTILEDGFESDLNIYDHVHGYICVNIAGRRHAGIENAPRLDFSNGKAFVASHMARSKWCEDRRSELRYVPIDLPFAGETHEFLDPRECVCVLKKLRDLGYRMPEGVLDEKTYESDI